MWPKQIKDKFREAIWQLYDGLNVVCPHCEFYDVDESVLDQFYKPLDDEGQDSDESEPIFDLKPFNIHFLAMRTYVPIYDVRQSYRTHVANKWTCENAKGTLARHFPIDWSQLRSLTFRDVAINSEAIGQPEIFPITEIEQQEDDAFYDEKFTIEYNKRRMFNLKVNLLHKYLKLQYNIVGFYSVPSLLGTTLTDTRSPKWHEDFSWTNASLESLTNRMTTKTKYLFKDITKKLLQNANDFHQKMRLDDTRYWSDRGDCYTLAKHLQLYGMLLYKLICLHSYANQTLFNAFNDVEIDLSHLIEKALNR